MALFPRPPLLDPDPVARIKAELADEAKRRSDARLAQDWATAIVASERIDQLLANLQEILEARQNAGFGRRSL